ncbi:MAG: dihydrofolate reductase family protein [Acidimicrobiales bacterium]
MGKLVVTEFVSLDGVFEAPGGGEDFEHAGWTFTFDRGEEGNKFKLDELVAADAQLLGRVTYEAFASAWPSMTDDVGFADKMNGMRKYVVSATLADPTWANTEVIRDQVAEQVTALKDRYAGDILVAGSGRLVGSLMECGLVDEFRLMVFPIVLGSGKRLFADGTATTRLRLTDCTPIGSDGVTIQTFALAGPAADTAA